ncbi:MAG: SH3 domain-containing protein, partial [Thermomicrobiales bacterium]
TEMINKSIAINTREWDLVAGAYFGYGVDVNGTSTSSYMNMFRQHVINMVGTTPGATDWIMPPTPTPGPTNTPGAALFSIGATVTIGDNRINFRSSPGMTTQIISVLVPGTQATVLAGPTHRDNYQWYQIRTTTGTTGWAAGELLTLVGGSQPTQPASATPSRTPSATATLPTTFAQGDAFRVNVPRLNLRSSSSLSSPVVTVLNQGETGTVTGSPVQTGGAIWLPVSLGSRGSGWLAAQYVVETTAQQPSSTATRTPTVTRTPAVVASSTPTVAVQFATGSTIRVNVPLLNMRSSANPSAQVVVVLERGNAGTVTGGPVAAGGYTWIPVTIQGRGSGWVANRYIVQSIGSTATMTPTRTATTAAAASATSSSSQGGTYQVNVPILNLRATPSMTAAILGRLTQGLPVTHLNQTETADGLTWFRVRTLSQTGWVASRYLSAISTPSTATPTASATATLDPAVLISGESFRVSTGPLNMRSSFGTTSTIIRTLPAGTTGSILGGPTEASGYHWYRVSTQYGIGWVVGAYIQRTSVLAAGLGEAPSLTISVTPVPTIPAPQPTIDVAPTEIPATEDPTEEPVLPDSPTATIDLPEASETPLPPTDTATATLPPDSDGDGVEDALDACVGVVDAGFDSDGDGVDDNCDPTPLGEPTAPPVVEFQITASAGADTSVSAIDPSAVQPADQRGGLPVGGISAETAYVTFWVDGVGAAQITNLTLYLPVASGSGNVTISIIPGGVIDEWSLTAGTAPGGSAVTTLWAEAGTEIPVDLTGWIGGDGPLTIVVSGNGEAPVVLGSREGGWPARLVVTAIG